MGEDAEPKLADGGNLFAAGHGDDAGALLGGGKVHGDDVGVGMGRAQKRHMSHAFEPDIIGKCAPAV